MDDPEHLSVFFHDGVVHHKKVFSAKTLTTEHRPLMERETKRILDKFRQEAARNSISCRSTSPPRWCRILGLTNSPHEERVKRVSRALERSLCNHNTKGVAGLIHNFRVMYAMVQFMNKDVAPAKRARMANPQNDVISHMVQQNYPDKAIFIRMHDLWLGWHDDDARIHRDGVLLSL